MTDNIREGTDMNIQVELPEDIADALRAGGQDVGRATAESIALEGYRSGRLSEEQVRRLLGFESRFQVHAFLKEHQVYLHYTEQDLDQDLETARRFARWSSSPARHP
jgi:predicted HTH domain antitoxin